ncbi:hypothetical protein HYALB_00013252 [Hymenoscyphus albidus]|uniref:F-box domain-containing protein n=1 Tax=Hymenoscyphus albidus TaxID=595503 RepID=A0A9N9LUL0_9HELO|nr:hypothetical protein HYALB_00013252 [Hymenoscyphus albidus]
MLTISEIIAGVSVLFSGRLAKPITPNQAQEGLPSLPMEVLLLIAQFLSTPSIACLALSIRSLNNILGKSARETLQHQDKETRLEYLILLSKSRPPPERLWWSHGPCWMRYHRVADVGNDYNPMSTSAIRFGFSHVNAAMKRHHQGNSHGIPVSAFFFTGLRDAFTGPKIIISTEARIVDNNFLYRVHQCVLLPRDCCQDFADKGYFANGGSCAHEGLETPIRLTLKNILVALDPLPENGQCRECSLDYEVIGVDCGEMGITIFFTRWLDFGSGISPYDRKWLEHISGVERRSRRSQYAQTHVLGSIRQSFDGAPGESLVDLRKANVRRWFSWLAREQKNIGDNNIWVQAPFCGYDSKWWRLADV